MERVTFLLEATGEQLSCMLNPNTVVVRRSAGVRTPSRTHGHVGAYTALSKEKLVLTERRGLDWYRSSEGARRGFCRICGASLFFGNSGLRFRPLFFHEVLLLDLGFLFLLLQH